MVKTRIFPQNVKGKKRDQYQGTHYKTFTPQKKYAKKNACMSIHWKTPVVIIAM